MTRPGRLDLGTRSWVLSALLAISLPLSADGTSWGGSIRTYGFLQSDQDTTVNDGRRDTQFAVLRLTGEGRLENGWGYVGHGVLSFRSPPLTGPTGLADRPSSDFLPLQTDLLARRGADVRGELDRLYLHGSFGLARFVAGRQAVTWGTNYFWPALDLFAPFRPFQIDRDYKSGVDAIRVIVPTGDFSEIEVIGAVLGSSLGSDGAAAALARFHLGRADLGLMGGSFHGDTVLGGFVTADLAGSGWRGELTHTRSGDDADAARDRRHFWRGSIGFDRLLTPLWSLTLELAWNGFGAHDPRKYPEVAAADRVQRGEVNALGKRHAGMSLEWQLHPLWVLGNALLVNLDDPSALWQPTLRWSMGNDTELLLGTQLSIGPSRDNDGAPRSEYGLAPSTLFVGFIGYF